MIGSDDRRRIESALAEVSAAADLLFRRPKKDEREDMGRRLNATASSLRTVLLSDEKERRT